MRLTQTLLGLLIAATLAACAGQPAGSPRLTATPTSSPTPTPTTAPAGLSDSAFLQATDPGRPSPIGEDLVDSARAGDESIVLSHTVAPDYGGQTIAITSYTAVVRLSDRVAVVAVHGWETNSAVPADADQLFAAAVTRAR